MNTLDYKIEGNKILLSGPMTSETVLKALVYSKKHMKAQNLVINMEKVTHCDSSALAYMMALIRFAKKQNTTISFYALPKSLLDIAKVSGVRDSLPII